MKIKILGILVIILLLTGCDANYSAEIKENTFKEETTIIPNSSKTEKIQNKPLENYLQSFVGTKIPSFYNADSYNGENEGEKEGIEYYDITSYQNGIQSSYSFNFYNLHRSLVIKECFDEINVQKNENIYRINTNNYCKAFDKYSLLDHLTIELVVDYNVIYANADQVEGNHYFWYLDTENYDHKNISLSFNIAQEDLSDFDPTNKEQNTELKKWLNEHSGIVILISFLIFGAMISLFLFIKVKVSKKK